ncbi:MULTISPECIES: 3-hydroxylacyl-ACP dehydratase [unclassified Paludibacterium]|uniref:3-hydroxylacyl-ACP dehydratase n=1 Tax=unclassified Paludibacterium TaxID=2618429 RepID=UPI001C04F552|nr:3-hydroxylacyl-ACP dehydratase [Paludibacterium sp. B53371]BEV73818.1 phosphotransferase [Paludibacterium sp. THUN1379]
MIDRQWIAAHIPHQGKMCLLDSVRDWNEQEIYCLTDSHCQADNPLRAHDRLGISTAIEYAAQAMAVHGALLAQASPAPKAGFLTSARDVRWHVARLDQSTGPLTVHATRLSGSAVNALYQFEILADEQVLASGRLAAILDADAYSPKV